MQTTYLWGTAMLCLLTVFTHAHGAGIYKWTDEQGVTHYADRPSMNHSSTRLSRSGLPKVSSYEPPPPLPAYKSSVVKHKSRPRRKTSKPDCGKYRAEIGKIEASLRRGYVEPTGSRLRERKRHWTGLLQSQCY